MSKRVVNVSVLPGEPLDGSGKVCIHLFVQDGSGSFVEPHVLHMEQDETGRATGRLMGKPTRGRLACDPRRGVRATTRGTVISVTPRSDDPRAVTCPKCCASAEYTRLMELITAT